MKCNQTALLLVVGALTLSSTLDQPFASALSAVPLNSARPNNALSPPVPNRVTTVTTKTKKTIHFRKKREGTQFYDGSSFFKWANFIYHRLEEAEVGKVDKEYLDQVRPIIASWAKNKDNPESAEKAQFLLDRYVQEFIAGNKHANPELWVFNAAMDGWAKSRRKNAPQKIEAILQTMKNLRLNHNLKDLEPDVISLSSLVLAWVNSRAPEAVEKALCILDYMEKEGFDPSTITYNKVLLSFVHSTLPDKAVKAEALIKRMSLRHREENKDCAPDIYSFQSLIAAWSRTKMSGTPQKAEEVLHFLDSQSEKGRKNLTPNAHCYTAAMHAWSNSIEDDKGRRAYELLQKMNRLYEATKRKNLKPNVVAYTAVINACALPYAEREHSKALNIAQLVMEELRYSEHASPNFLSYSAMLHVIATTLEKNEKRDALSYKYFEEAIHDGQVGYLVLEKLQIAAPNVYNALVEDLINIDADGNKVVEIPAEWGENVKGERDPSQRLLKDTPVKFLNRVSYQRLKEVKKKYGERVEEPYIKSEKIREGDVKIKWKVQSWND